MGLQGFTQETVTRPVGEEPTYYEDGPACAFAPGEVRLVLEQPASRADLRDLNRENDATVEEDLPRSDVNVIDLPPDLSVTEAEQAYEGSPDLAYAEPNFRVFPSSGSSHPHPQRPQLQGPVGPQQRRSDRRLTRRRRGRARDLGHDDRQPRDRGGRDRQGHKRQPP